jgi:predicted alpha-1,2-mannosidase
MEARLRKLFYTALYHALIEPSTLSDADGSYRGMDNRVHVSRRSAQYTDISGWDIYRAQVPLLAMLDPARASGLAESLLRDAQQSGCLPRWPYANQQTNVMTGDPSDDIFAGSSAFGARSFNREAALAEMVAGASRPCRTVNGDYTEREGLGDYLRLGYVPQDDNTDVVGHTIGHRTLAWGSAATTLEDATADSAISRFAAGLRRSTIARLFLKRSENWKHLYDPSSGYIRPRYRSGTWQAPFGPTTAEGFVEGNATQYTWSVPQDPEGLFRAMGGPGAAGARLTGFFKELNAGPNRPYAFLGNEPTLAVPWLYDWLGRPARASDVVRRALLGLYAATPSGMPGNDDGGTLSAWWVLGSLGIYPAVPGSDTLALNAPLFSRASISLPHGVLVIEASALSRSRRYIQSAALDRRSLELSRLRFSDLSRGRHVLRLKMTDNANPAWARTVG